MQLDYRICGAFADRGGLVFKIFHLGLQKRPFLVERPDFEPLLAFGGYVETAIVILLDDRNDACRTANGGERVFLGPDHPERTVLRQALADHFLIARLKNVQWQRRTRKDNDFQRK